MARRGGAGGIRFRPSFTSPQNYSTGPSPILPKVNNYLPAQPAVPFGNSPVTRSVGRQQQQQQPQPLVQQPQQQQFPIVNQPPSPSDAPPAPIFAPEDDNKDLLETSETMDMTEGSDGGPKKRFRYWGRRDINPLEFSKLLKTNIGGKISKNILRRRQNARLRTILTPKNSMMVLYELHPELKLTISEDVNATNQMTYTVKVEIGGRTFTGQGMSKAAAKQAASENALKSVLLEKLEQNNIRLSTSSTTLNEDLETSMETNPEENAEKKEGDEEPKKPRKPIAEDDVPWGSLASFALYKLFSDWQSQGFQLPANAGIAGIFQKHAPPQTNVSPKKLPPDANQKHPVQLLNQVRPGSQYIESREGVPPNLTFTFTVIVDGKTYKGTGNNKKDAKKQCAKSVLEAMGVQYD